MTPTNAQIQKALFDLLIAANLGYPTSWPGLDFTAPASGVWLEVSFFPNEGIDDGLGYDSTTIPQGIFQVTAATRPGDGVFPVTNAAQEVQAVFSKGTTISTPVRVQRSPYQMDPIFEGDRMMIPVTITYSG